MTQPAADQIVERQFAGAVQQRDEQKEAPVLVIAQTDLAEPGIGDDGDDVEDEEAEGRETRAEPEHKKDRKAQFGGRAQPGSQYGRQERHRILALKESQRGRPTRDLR